MSAPGAPKKTGEAQGAFDRHQTHGRHAAIGALQNLGAKAVALSTGFATTVFLTRRLGPELYGQYSVAFGIVLWMELLGISLLDSTTVRLVAEADDWEATSSTLVQIQLFISLISTVLLFVTAPLIAAGLGSPGLEGHLRVFALEIPLFGLNRTHKSILIGRGAFERGAIVIVVYWLSRIALMLLLVGLGLSVTGAILANVGAAAVQLVAARVYVRPALLRRPTARMEIRGITDYAVPLSFHNIVTLFITKGDLLIVRACAALPGAAGFYSAANDLATLPVSSLVTSFSPLLLASLTHLWESGRESSAQSMARQTLRLGLCLLPFAALVVGSAPGIITFVYGEAYLPAGRLLALLMVAAMGSMPISILTRTLAARGRPHLILTVTLPQAALAVAGYLILTPRLGPVGAAAARTTLTILAAIALFGIVGRTCGVHLPLATALRTGLTAMMAYAASAIWQTSGWLVVAELLLLSLGILGCLFLLGELTQLDVQFAASLLRLKPRRSNHLIEGES